MLGHCHRPAFASIRQCPSSLAIDLSMETWVQRYYLLHKQSLCSFSIILYCFVSNYCTGTLGENEVRTTLPREGDARYYDPVETQSWPTDLHSVIVAARVSPPQPASLSCQSVWMQVCVSQPPVINLTCFTSESSIQASRQPHQT